VDSESERQDVDTIDTIRFVNGGLQPGMLFFVIMGVIVITMVIIALLLLKQKGGNIPPRTRY
jgi:hypothetical protein